MAYASISKPELHFDGKIYLGSSSAVTVSGLGFQPDLVWVKDRDNANQHVLVDAVRGAGKFLQSNLANAEVNNSSQSITAFTSDGFTTGTANPANESASTTKGFISWNWKANGQGSSNTDGSINTTYTSANTTSGFSIVKYTGTEANATIGHGLSTAPKVIIIKGLSTTHDWVYGGDNIGWTKYLNLNNSSAGGTASAVWNDTAPTSSVFSVGNNQAVNQSGVEHIAYCFAEKKGYSKFGSYTGNGNADGTFVYTGFKPAFLLTKNSGQAGDSWNLLDATRNPGNPGDKRLTPDVNSVEATTTQYDILSNGFKVRATTGAVNNSNVSYIYMAFAEEPLVANVGTSIPATAR